MKKFVLTSLTVLLFSALSYGQTTLTITASTPTGSTTFDANGTVTVAADVSANITYQIWSGGDGGVDNLGAGGAGGQYISVTATLVGAPGTGTSYPVTVGAGGASGGGLGGSSIFNGTTVTGGGGASGGAAAVNKAGGGGGEGACSSGTASAGSAGVQGGGTNGTGGAGGTGCDGGDGGVGGESGADGAAGIQPGGGGGGGGSTAVGGSGGAGRVVITITATPVPVTFSYFKVEGKELTWQTASERNNDLFEVERKVDGSSDFEMIGVVKGMGWSDELVDYQFQDNSRVAYSNVCYRLKQVDYDGDFEYSDVVCVSTEEIQSMEAFPNPIQDELDIIGLNKDVSTDIELVSVYGEVLIIKNSDFQHRIKLNTSMLEPGTYFIRAEGQVLKVIKQ